MSEPDTNQSLAREALDAVVDDLLPELRFQWDYDDQGVDPGDWLPKDKEHYDRVGPFRGNPANEDDEDQANWRDLTWEEWSRRYDADLEHWRSFGMSLQIKCNLGEWHDAGPSLWGMDFLDYNAPNPGEQKSYAELEGDPWLKETARELAAEYVHECIEKEARDREASGG